jgi:hypothetical protein
MFRIQKLKDEYNPCKYFDSNPNVCPKCGSRNTYITGSMTPNMGGPTTQNHKCKDCGKEWDRWIPDISRRF